MHEIKVTDFRQQCLALLGDLPAEGIVITKHGHPIAKLMPIRKTCSHLIGSVPGIIVNRDDHLFSTGIEWDAQS